MPPAEQIKHPIRLSQTLVCHSFMTIHQLPLEDTHQFSSLLTDFVNRQDTLRPFYGQYPDLEGFKAQLSTRQFLPEQRQVLVQSLRQQYSGVSNPPDFAVLEQPNAFTVTTGHQLNLCTGPLYVIYKLVTIINLAKQLKAAFPAYEFVPVYWMATEDHDFAEINHFTLFGKTYAWQTEQKGAVGRMNPAEALAEVADKPTLFEQAYTQASTLAQAVRLYMHDLFGADGLICLDADAPALKRLFVPIAQDDLLHHTVQHKVEEQSARLEAAGYSAQVTARAINLFYLAEGLRERIVKEGGVYRVLNTSLEFSEAEILDLLDKEPEKFSPNVILRPVYQEVILPNLAYIGGPGELAYWLQFKAVFEQYQVPYPVLMPRNFALVVNAASTKRIEKLGLAVQELFWDEVRLRKTFVERNAEHSLDLSESLKLLDQAFEQILSKAVLIDKTLEGAVNSEKQKTLNSVENLEKRIKKAEERNQETTVNQLLALKAKLFPGGGLQERSENFLNFYLNDPEFLNKLKQTFDPFNFKFYVLVED